MAEKKNVNLENNMLSEDELDMVSGGETLEELKHETEQKGKQQDIRLNNWGDYCDPQNINI